MKIFTVIHKPVESLGAVMLIDGPSVSAHGSVEDAETAAREMAAKHRGSTFLIVAGEPVAAFRAEPVKVDLVKI